MQPSLVLVWKVTNPAWRVVAAVGPAAWAGARLACGKRAGAGRAEEAIMTERSTAGAARRPADASDARLEGARLAARGIAHTLNNDLTQAVGRLSFVLLRGDLPPAARADLQAVEAALLRLARHLAQCQRIERLVTRDTVDGPLLELEHSTASTRARPPGQG
jgi:hypothetical protein